MEILNKITEIILYVLSGLIAFKIFYCIAGFLIKAKKFPDAKQNHKYAVVIAARNEEKVIGNLVDSLINQDYPKELLTVFVVADNCTDRTAQIAREHGAIVYERFEPEKARKGWALEFLFENIQKDYGIESFEAYQIFDADNVVSPDYFKQVNKVFDTGADAVTGYLHSKNYGTNFISAAYGLHFCRSMMSMHRPRTLLGTSTHFNGTGALIKSKYIKDGWNFTLLTEDTEACNQIISSGGKIVACEDATFFDESPTNFKLAFRQRLRWTRGRLTVFFKKGGKNIKGLFKVPAKRKFACYDNFFYLFPYALFTLFISAIYPVTSTIISLANGAALPVLDWLKAAGIGLLTSYLTCLLEGTLIIIRERKHIYCSVKKRILYLFAWPWFDLISLPLMLVTMFFDVKWKPIEHKDPSTINDLIKTAPSTDAKVKAIANSKIADFATTNCVTTGKKVKRSA